MPEPRRDIPRQPQVDPLVAAEEAAAAAEAARIGGVVPRVVDDPALEPLYEAGEGEEDGWELAEAELIENASQGDGHADPELVAGALKQQRCWSSPRKPSPLDFEAIVRESMHNW
jgi:hypothetical protein